VSRLLKRSVSGTTPPGRWCLHRGSDSAELAQVSRGLLRRDPYRVRLPGGGDDNPPAPAEPNYQAGLFVLFSAAIVPWSASLGSSAETPLSGGGVTEVDDVLGVGGATEAGSAVAADGDGFPVPGRSQPVSNSAADARTAAPARNDTIGMRSLVMISDQATRLYQEHRFEEGQYVSR
jgi:hypothetical protein